MIINENIKEFKIKRTISEYKNTINKYGQVHIKQIEFAKQLTDMVYNNNTDKVELVIARCGMGKSVIIKAILNNLVNNYMHIGTASREQELGERGAIVITDSLERLEDIKTFKGLEDRCYLMKNDLDIIETENRKDLLTKIKEQFKYPILLMTTQRYFSMSDDEREFMYSWAKGKREVAFIDEKPIFAKEDVINEKFLSEIRIALHECLESENKNYLLNTFDKIYNDLDYIRKTYSHTYEVMWLKSSKKSILTTEEEDEKFFDILSNNVSSKIYNDVLTLKRIYIDGCLFVNKKSKSQDNTRQFIVLNDNSNKFDTDKCKYFILDATAKYDADYMINKNLFNYVEIDDKKENIDINIHYIPYSTSKNSLNNDNKVIEMISNWINNTCEKDVFVATYGKKSGLYQKFEKQLETNNLGYFGAIKGKNDWQNLNCMAHIGFNRQSDVSYLLTHIYITKNNLKWNKQETEDIFNKINNLLEMEKGMFEDILMSKIMRSKILVDTEQNIMRIKCRHFNNTDICNVFIIVSNSYEDYISRISDKLNAKVLKYIPNEFEEYKTMSRKPIQGKEKTNPQILKCTLESIEKGTVVKMKNVIELSGLSRDQIKECKKSNEYIKKWFDEHKGIKKGEYVA